MECASKSSHADHHTHVIFSTETTIIMHLLLLCCLCLFSVYHGAEAELLLICDDINETSYASICTYTCSGSTTGMDSFFIFQLLQHL